MTNIKTIGLISAGVAVAFGSIVVMNIAASGSDADNFEGGVSQQALPRQLPESNADPFQVIADQDEASRRATSNRAVAAEEIARNGGQPSYTAPPVIQMEGNSGDAYDPMAGAWVDQNETPMPEALAETQIEPVRAPEVDYKVPETAPVATQEVTTAPTPTNNADDLLLRAMLAGGRSSSQSISINTFTPPENTGQAPMVIMEFGEGQATGGNAGLPISQLPNRAPAPAPATTGVTTAPVPPITSTAPSAAPREAPAAPPASVPGPRILPTPSGSGAGEGVLRTIDPNNPSSYINGSLFNAGALDRFAGVMSEHDVDYDPRQPVEYAQTAIDNNSRIYDTARNGGGFDAGSLLLPGDQRYATLLYGFNSDDAAQLPVFAQIHDYGPASSSYLNGARLQGTLRLSAESAVMEFDRLIMQDGRVIPISAMGISADQLRVGVFDNVNRHTISRYSSLLVSGLIQGFGNVGERIVENRFGGGRNGNVIIIGDGSDAGSQNWDGEFTDGDRAAIAMGAVRPIGDALADSAAEGFNRKPTVTAPAGFGFSVVFLEGLPFGQVQ